MSIYFIARNVAAAQSSPHTVGSQIVQPSGPQNPNMPPTNQSFELEVDGIGDVSATAVVAGSNDVVNYSSGAPMQWTSIGSPLVAIGTDKAVASVNGENSYAYYAAYITAISGTNALATVRMAA